MESIISKKVKKRSPAGVIAISILFIFSACGGGSSGDSNNNNTNNTNQDSQMTWSAPELLESSNFNVHDMDVAVSGSDSFVVVWGQDVAGSNEAVYSSEIAAGGNWSAAEKIYGDVFSVHDGPEIDINSSGEGFVIWGEMSPSAAQRSLAYDSVNGFDPSSEIISSGLFAEGDIHVADDGKAVFAGDMNTRIWSASYDGSWSGGINIDSNSGNAFETVIAGNPAGFVPAAWETDGSVVHAALYDGSSWSSSEEISTGIDNESPHTAVDENNNVIVVWDNSESSYHIYAAVYTHGSGWSTAQNISSNGRAAGADPKIGFDGSGNAIAVWEENDGLQRTIYANRYIQGSGWGSDQRIGNLTGEAHDPQIALNSAGKAVVIWEQEESGDYNIYSAQYLPGSGSWTDTELLETDNGESRYGRVAIDENGYAVAIWQHFDGAFSSIKAACLR